MIYFHKKKFERKHFSKLNSKNTPRLSESMSLSAVKNDEFPPNECIFLVNLLFLTALL